jgi:hypothetical protein
MRTCRRACVYFGGAPQFIFTGSSTFIDDGDGNYRIKFLSSGILNVSRKVVIDAFLVGGGAGGKRSSNYGGGGGSGLTLVCPSVALQRGTDYSIVVAATQIAEATDGNTTSAFGCSASGGTAASAQYGGAGGSGGGSGGQESYQRGAGGSDGASGSGSTPGSGQGTTTREFGESTGTLYGGAGGGYDKAGGDGGGGNGYGYDGTSTEAMSAAGNSGGGAGGASGGTQYNYGYGGSGVVVIRNHRTV